MQETLHNYTNLDIKAASVHDLVLDQTADSLQPNTWASVTGVRLGWYPDILHLRHKLRS